MLQSFLLALLIAAADPAVPRLISPGALVSAEDYPLEFLRNEEEGTVVVRLNVGTSGDIASCAVTSSSGHPALDERTCELLRARAKFEPARDRNGRAIESAFTQQISWRIGESRPMAMPRTVWMTRATLGIASSGIPVDCTLEAAGITGWPSDCTPPRPPGEAVPAAPVEHSISETHFFPLHPDDAPAVPELDGATMEARQVSRLTIAPDGQIIACEPVAVSRKASDTRDRCLLLSGLRFEPAPEGSGPATATLVLTNYARAAAVD